MLVQRSEFNTGLRTALYKNYLLLLLSCWWIRNQSLCHETKLKMQSLLLQAKTLFSQPSHTIVQLDSGVTQLDWLGGKLLASTLTRAYLLNTTK